MGFERKLAALSALNPDIAVLSEVACEHLICEWPLLAHSGPRGTRRSATCCSALSVPSVRIQTSGSSLLVGWPASSLDGVWLNDGIRW